MQIEKNYSNPIKKWLDGNTDVPYTFEGGEHPYHLFIETKSWIPLSLMVFADNEKHAIKILRGIIKWAKESKEFESSCPWTSNGYLKAWTTALRNKTLQVQKVEKNQAFKIGWAGNDTYISV